MSNKVLSMFSMDVGPTSGYVPSFRIEIYFDGETLHWTNSKGHLCYSTPRESSQMSGDAAQQWVKAFGELCLERWSVWVDLVVHDGFAWRFSLSQADTCVFMQETGAGLDIFPKDWNRLMALLGQLNPDFRDLIQPAGDSRIMPTNQITNEVLEKALAEQKEELDGTPRYRSDAYIVNEGGPMSLDGLFFRADDEEEIPEFKRQVQQGPSKQRSLHSIQPRRFLMG